jgi:hypothetical protein
MIRQLRRMSGPLAALVAAGFSSAARAVIVPFTEHFVSNAANWYDPPGTAPASWVADGGPDASSYISTIFNFVDQAPGQPIPSNAVALFRAQDEFNSSDHAFEGDWIDGGVTDFSFWVRHNAPSAMNFFARFATANNFPAWSGVEFAPIAPNTWTQISFEISFDNPNLFYEGPPPSPAQFEEVFRNIGHVQVGVFGGSMAGIDHEVTFDLDQPTVAPSPSALALLALSGLCRRPRRRT